MPDEIDAAFAQIEAQLRLATVEGARECAALVGSAVGKKVRRSRPVSDQDLLPGVTDPSRKVVIENTAKGAEITLNPSYVRLTPELRAIVLQVDPGALPREGLLVKTKAGTKRHYQDFSDAPRLRDWAKSHGQQDHRVIFAGGIVAKAAFVDPVLEKTKFAEIVAARLR